MNEITLSDNLAQIEYEIREHKSKIGQSIWEIGRRLKHVKENDLAHGQFLDWVERIGIARNEAQKYIKIVNELSPNYETFNNLGLSALYLIATLPDDEKQTQLDRIENGDNPTVRELQDVKRKLKLAEAENKKLFDEKEQQAEEILNLKLNRPKAEVKVIERKVIKEVVPDDYRETKALNETLLDKNKDLQQRFEDLENRNQFIEEQHQKLLAQRAEVDEKSAKYDELTKAIEASKGQLDAYQKKIFAYKEIQSLLKKGNQLLSNIGGIVYVDVKPVIETEPVIKSELETFYFLLSSFTKEVAELLNEQDIIEGEIL